MRKGIRKTNKDETILKVKSKLKGIKGVTLIKRTYLDGAMKIACLE
jgi:hypothetical protein